MKNLFITSSSILLAVYFLSAGVGKFLFWDMHVALMESHEMIMVPALLATAGIFQISGSICLIINRYVFVCSLGFAIMIILINLNLHDFWNVYEGVDSGHETQNFIKNLGVFLAFLLLAAVNIEDKSQRNL